MTVTVATGTGYNVGATNSASVVVNDDDNGAPVFSGQPTAATVAENSADGTAVKTVSPSAALTVTATDGDGDTLSYSLDADSDKLFDIDSSTGAITVQVESGSALDHEAASSITATVTANDGTATTDHNVTISVTDVDEPPDAPAAPTVAGASGTSVSVSWTAPDVTGKPALSDYDVQYKLTTETDWTDHGFTGTGTSTTITGLTEGETYNVQVRATNAEGTSDWSATGSGTPSNSVPVFTNQATAATVPENSADGTKVQTGNPAQDLAITATDADGDTLTYTLDTDSDKLFDIDSSTGAITVKVDSGSALDHEASSSITATVTASDGTATTDHNVTITVSDENEPPAAPGAPTVSGASGTSVSVTWTAPDVTGKPAISDYDVQYKLMSETNWTDASYDGTGTTTTITGLANETTYNVQVRASNDEGTSDWSATGSGDTNANSAPVFSGQPTAATVAENSDDDTAVMTGNPAVALAITATDADNDTLSYSLDATSDKLFDIDSSTGAITVKVTEGSLDHEAASSITATVTATDSNSATDTHAVTISVTDADEPPDAPEAPTVTAASSTSVSVSWSAPDVSGKPAITDYDVRFKLSTVNTWSDASYDGTGASTTISSLTKGSTYNVQVRATNDEGTSGWSATGSGVPSNISPTGSVTIDDTDPTEDETLTANTSTVMDADGLGTFSYQWARAGTDITGATSSTYVLVQADVGNTITVTVSYTDGGGNAESLTSAATIAVANVNDDPTGSVTIDDTDPTEDETLTANTSGVADEDGLGEFSYQWARGGTDITGATSSTYVLVQDDVGNTITVTVSYTDDGGSAESLTSSATAAVANVNDDPTGSVTISGTVTEDQTLTADTSGIADEDGLGEFSYQWARGGTNITGATSSTYVLVQADVGETITVTASYTDGQGTAESVTSAATTAVANVNDLPTGSVTITGTVTQNQTITANTSGIADEDGLGAFSYQWARAGTDISGATSSTYTLLQADVDSTMTVTVSYTDGQGTAESLTSAATRSVVNVNDPPVFSNQPTAATINENSAGGTAVATVTATDVDTGDTLTYSLDAASDAVFNIGSSSGAITVQANATLDHEATASITATVTVTDSEGATDTHSVVVTIADLSEPPDAPGAPGVTGASNVSVNVSWTAPGNSGRPAISDYDVRYRASGTTAWTGHPFDGAGTSTTIEGLAPSTTYEVQVLTRNADGASGWSAAGSGATNANSAPAFSNQPTTATVNENSLGGTAVMTVTATDADTADTLSYSLDTVADAVFDIDSSGNITVQAVATIDHEATPTITATVTASDEHGGSGTHAVTITIADVDEPPPAPVPATVAAESSSSLAVDWSAPDVSDRPDITDYDVQYRAPGVAGWTDAAYDGTESSATLTGLSSGTTYEVQVRATNIEGTGRWSGSSRGTTNTSTNTAPVFTDQPAAAAVDENSAAGTAVVTITATDADAGDTLSYALDAASAAVFSIDASGAITVTADGTLDHEATPSHAATVTATDGESATATHTVEIAVTDVDEPPDAPEAPTVSGDSTSSVTVGWTAPDGTGRPAITDYDVQYRASGDTDWIDASHDGDETTATIESLSAGVTYEARVRAVNDEGESGWSATGSGATGSIANDPPVFTSPPDALEVAENSAGGANVGRVAATDPDGDTLTYTLDSASAAAFDIDSGGVITVASGAALDHETTPSYSVAVTAADINDATAVHTVTIRVTDVDEPPAAPGAPSVAGATATSLAVTWTAPDVSDRPPVTDYDVQYRAEGATGWSDAGYDGTATTATIASLTAGVTYQVQVRAVNDEGAGEWSATGSGATGVNSAPAFTGQDTAASVDENSAGGTAVVTITATDADGDAIRYSLDTASTAVFRIDAAGAITVRADNTLDHEATPSYTVTVTATDSNNAAASHTVTIGVTDVDEPPDAPDAPSVRGISMSSVRVTWTAPDTTGRPAITDYDVQYRASGDTDWIDAAHDGDSTRTTIADLASDVTYEVQVRAVNDEGASGWSATGSGATGSFVNSEPEFTGQDTTASVAENSADGTAVVTVTATDADGDTLTYSLDSTSDAVFDIDSSGAVTVQVESGSALDHEARSSYTAMVTATDGEGATGTHTVTIAVTDEDEPPDAPDAPAVAGASTTSVDVTWTAPDMTGKPPITDYDVQYRAAGDADWIDVAHDGAGYERKDPGPESGRRLRGAGAGGQRRGRERLVGRRQRRDRHARAAGRRIEGQRVHRDPGVRERTGCHLHTRSAGLHGDGERRGLRWCGGVADRGRRTGAAAGGIPRDGGGDPGLDAGADGVAAGAAGPDGNGELHPRRASVAHGGRLGGGGLHRAARQRDAAQPGAHSRRRVGRDGGAGRRGDAERFRKHGPGRRRACVFLDADGGRFGDAGGRRCGAGVVHGPGRGGRTAVPPDRYRSGRAERRGHGDRDGARRRAGLRRRRSGGAVAGTGPGHRGAGPAGGVGRQRRAHLQPDLIAFRTGGADVRSGHAHALGNGAGGRLVHVHLPGRGRRQ